MRTTSAATQRTAGIHPRWLVVDDQGELSALISEVLAGLGASVHSFTGSTEALAAFATEPGAFDLVVTDFDMPKMDGLKLARSLHALQPGVKIVLVSANADLLTNDDLASAGIAATVGKPFSVAELESTVQAVVGSACEMRALNCRVVNARAA